MNFLHSLGKLLGANQSAPQKQAAHQSNTVTPKASGIQNNGMLAPSQLLFTHPTALHTLMPTLQNPQSQLDVYARPGAAPWVEDSLTGGHTTIQRPGTPTMDYQAPVASPLLRNFGSARPQMINKTSNTFRSI